jgi:hypothetical protein
MCARHQGNMLAFRHSDGTPLLFCTLHSKERFARTRLRLVHGDPSDIPDVAADVDEPDPGPNEYELKRLQNIERNRRRLAELQTGSC